MRIAITKELDSVAAGKARDYISEVCESSLWAALCDCLAPADVLVLRSTGSKYHNAKLHGEFAELWFFLMIFHDIIDSAGSSESTISQSHTRQTMHPDLLLQPKPAWR